MTALVIPCPHCSQKSQLDSERLPDQPVCFACPGCQQKVVVDKRQLLSQQSNQSAAAPGTGAQQAATSTPAGQAPPAPPAKVTCTAPVGGRLPKLPADATFPSGIILGEDDTVIGEIQNMLAALGSEVEPVSSPDEARQVIINERPELCIYVAGNVTAPPYEPMAPLTGLPPDFRRRLFLALIADNLKTLDGNAAFMYQVNMILARQDFPQFGAALYGGIDYHHRLYEPYFLATESRGSI